MAKYNHHGAPLRPVSPPKAQARDAWTRRQVSLEDADPQQSATFLAENVCTVPLLERHSEARYVVVDTPGRLDPGKKTGPDAGACDPGAPEKTLFPSTPLEH
ncbi:MAG: hypothetical protein M2R45_01451 [Verrucomicrobia subdivision 3 bacterium]|nr:hypothetical protein [Limisphaerales bacterium]MCS1417604.1 hypothetical protein [Limisphaerales bacterium]